MRRWHGPEEIIMATRWSSLPGGSDDVVKRSVEDYRKFQKAQNVDSSKLKGGARQAVLEAGDRGLNRNLGRAGLAAAALSGGYDLGREIDERTGLGKKLVDKSGLGDLAARVATSGPRVQLTPEAKARIAAGELDKADKTSAPDTEDTGKQSASPEFGSYKRGGKVKTKKMASGGSTSMSKASKRADGIAQRGKTRGKMC